MNNKVILSRPNLFIVNEMKGLIADSAGVPWSLGELSELESIYTNEIRGIVVSTSLHSSIKASYTEVVVKIKELFPDKPILLACMIEFNKMKKSVEANLKKAGIVHNLLSVTAASQVIRFDKKVDFIVIQKSDITDKTLYPKTLEMVKKYFS